MSQPEAKNDLWRDTITRLDKNFERPRQRRRLTAGSLIESFGVVTLKEGGICSQIRTTMSFAGLSPLFTVFAFSSCTIYLGFGVEDGLRCTFITTFDLDLQLVLVTNCQLMWTFTTPQCYPMLSIIDSYLTPCLAHHISKATYVFHC